MISPADRQQHFYSQFPTKNSIMWNFDLEPTHNNPNQQLDTLTQKLKTLVRKLDILSISASKYSDLCYLHMQTGPIFPHAMILHDDYPAQSFLETSDNKFC